jgi:hypothetical protein
MRNKDALEKDLEDGRWITMKALADLALEEGDLVMAAGWRWLAEHHKWPHANGNNYIWHFWSAIKGDDLGTVTKNPINCHNLPKLLRCQEPRCPKYRKSLLQLLLKTARAVGARLLGEIKPDD